MQSYDEDFFEWTRRSPELLRAGQLDRADIEHIAEEIEDIGKRDLREVNSRMRVLLIHLSYNQASAVRRAVGQTDLPPSRFPGECPFTVEQLLHPEFLP